LLFEYSHLRSVGRLSIPVDLEIGLFMVNAEQIQTAIASYTNWWALLPGLMLALLSFFYRSDLKAFGRNFLILLPVVISLFFFSYLDTFLKNNNLGQDFPLGAFNNFFKTSSGIPPVWLFAYPDQEREKLNAAFEIPEAPSKNIIFIVDESVRANNLSLYDYSRRTTPYLEHLQDSGQLIKFDSSVSGSTCSISSAQLLMTGVRIADLPDTDSKLRRYPTLFQYAKLMGYKVSYFDGQIGNFWMSQYGDQNEYLDVWKNPDDFKVSSAKSYENDFRMAREIARVITSSTGNFIWIWKRGVHFPYHKNHPAEANTWKSNSRSSNVGRYSRQELINSYDNAIKYNLDGFFKILTPAIYENENNVLIYTSDHGQNLLEGKHIATHCMDSKNEVNVPLFMMGDFVPRVGTDFKAAHGNLFATFLDLFKVPESLRKYEYDDSLLNPGAVSPKHRYYWNKDLKNGKKLLFDQK
jgi:glucan phosphoethanolaminetransferase (alkaline phosphatase superfamily)